MYARYKGDRSQAFLKANRKGKKYWANGNRGYGKYGKGKKMGEGHKEKKEKRDD